MICTAMTTGGLSAATTFEAAWNDRVLTVYPARVSAAPINREWPGKQSDKSQTEISGFVTFDMEREGTLKLKYSNPEKKPVQIRPLEYDFEREETEDGMTIKIARPCQFTVEVGGTHQVLHVFANPVADYKKTGNEIHFGPGVHHAGVIVPESGQTIRIDEGAVVYGAFSFITPRT